MDKNGAEKPPYPPLYEMVVALVNCVWLFLHFTSLLTNGNRTNLDCLLVLSSTLLPPARRYKLLMERLISVRMLDMLSSRHQMRGAILPITWWSFGEGRQGLLPRKPQD